MSTQEKFRLFMGPFFAKKWWDYHTEKVLLLVVCRRRKQMLDKLTVLISDHNDGCTFVSISFASRCKHSNAVVGVFIQTRQSSSSSWSRHELSFLRHTTQHPVGNSVTPNNAILISRWNLVPLNDNTSRACVKFANIIRRGIWLCNKRQKTNAVSTETRIWSS